MTSVFSDEQNAVRRKEYFLLLTMNPEAIGTSFVGKNLRSENLAKRGKPSQAKNHQLGNKVLALLTGNDFRTEGFSQQL